MLFVLVDPTGSCREKTISKTKVLLGKLMANMATKSLLKPFGTQSFQHFVQTELPTLQQSPILLLTSEAATVSLPPVAESCKWVQFTLSQQFGLRTVPANISAVFPSVQDLETRLDLLRRTGTSSIVAVGSGAAMDLAKALAAEKKDTIEHVVLVPSTYGAAVAAGSPHALLLDTIEETIIPKAGIETTSLPTTVVPLDAKYTADMDRSHILNACLAVTFDACLRESQHPRLQEMLHELNRLCLQGANKTEQLSDETVMDLCYQTGGLLSYGLESEDRSAPLALAASLIPQIFPHVHILSFWASLVHGLSHALQSSSSSSSSSQSCHVLALQLLEGLAANKTWLEAPRMKVTDEKLRGFSVPDMALSHIQANATVWKSFDLPNKVLTDILQHSIRE